MGNNPTNFDENSSTGLQAFTSLGKLSIYFPVITALFVFIVAAVVFTIMGKWFIVVISLILSSGLIVYLIIKIRRSINENQKTVDLLLEVIENKDNYITYFSHQIRTPLNNFSVISDLLSETKVDDKQKELIDTLMASTNNMVTAVNDLTMRSAGELSFEPKKKIKFNLISTLYNTIELFDLKSLGTIKIDIIPQEGLEKEYLSDPITLKQIFLDIFNSIEMKGKGELNVDIIISKTKLSKKIEILEFAISTDKPIQFIQTDPADPETVKNLSAKLISLQGGKYSLLTDEHSSVFKFTLPFDFVKEEEEVSEVAQRIKELETVSKKKKRMVDANVLLVEDNPTNQKIVMISLSGKVKSVDTAMNGKEALDMFGKSTYDIILMDIQLPVMDGITASEKIRELEASTSKHTPIIAITANAMIGDKEKCLSAGIDEYLSKPFQPSQLINLIKKLISS